MSKSQLEHHWTQHINAWRSSHLSQNAYCLQHSLRPNQFCYWKRKLSTLATRQDTNVTKVSSAFVPLAVDNSLPTNGLCLRLPNGCELSGIEIQHLATVAQLLEILQ